MAHDFFLSIFTNHDTTAVIKPAMYKGIALQGHIILYSGCYFTIHQ